MTSDLPTTARAEALRDHLSRHRATDGFELVDVREEADEVAVVFRWRANPHTFVIGFDREFTGFFGEEVGAGPHAWCEDIQFWLMEELDTGLLARAERHRAGNEVVLVAPAPTGAREDDGLWISDVPQFSPEVHLPWWWRLRLAVRGVLARLRGRPEPREWVAWTPLDEPPGDGRRDGEWLGEAGLDPARVREIRGEGRLLLWVQAYRDAPGPALGQCAAVVTDDPDVARIEVLEAGDEASTDVRGRLVDAAVHAAADLGARTLLVPDGGGGHEPVDTALC